MNFKRVETRKVMKEVLKAGQDDIFWLVSLIMKYKIFPEFPSTF